jgi:O-antigen/teichoic acid export membrane protein
MTNKVIKSSLWYTISSFLLSGISFLTTPLFTRILSLEEYGAYSNFNAVYSIISVIITLNLGSTLIRAQYDFSDDKEGYTSTLLYISTIIVFVALILGNIFYDQIFSFLMLDRFALNVMFVSLMFLPSVNIFQIWQRIEYKYKMSVLVSFLSSIGNVMFSLLFVFTFENKLNGRILGSQLAGIIIGFCILIYYIHRSKKFNIEYCKYALKICIPYLPHLLSLNILSMSDKLMITQISGSQYNALYSVAVNCGMIMTILMSALNNAFSPWLGEKLHLKQYDNIRYFSYIYIILFCAVAMADMLFAPELMLIFGGTKYIEAKYAIPPIIMGCMCQFLYTMYVNIEQYEKKTIGMAIASCIAALINIVTNIIFIPKYGYIAAAYTTLFSYFCLLILHYLLVRKMKLSKVYNTKYIFSILFILFLISIISINLYNYILGRYILIVVYITIILITFLMFIKSGKYKQFIEK